MEPPRPPFEKWPVQLQAPGHGYAWYTAPATLVNQVVATRGTMELAHWIHDVIDRVIARERKDIERHGGLLIIHDWRRLANYDKEARRAFLDRMRGREPGYMRGAVAVVPNTPLIRMAVQTANLVMALRTGGHLEVATDPGPALTAHAVQTPTERGWR